MPDKLRKTASDVKLMIEEMLRASAYPDCDGREIHHTSLPRATSPNNPRKHQVSFGSAPCRAEAD